MAEQINTTLDARKSRYGDFTDQARIEQSLMAILRAGRSWQDLDPVKRSALEMMCVKQARIVNGDPDYDDNWRDIVGYGTLVLERLPGGTRHDQATLVDFRFDTIGLGADAACLRGGILRDVSRILVGVRRSRSGHGAG